MSDWTEELQAEIDALRDEVGYLHLFISHLLLLRQMDRAEQEQGRKDPATLLAIDAQAAECLRPDDYMVLHREIEQRLPSVLDWG